MFTFLKARGLGVGSSLVEEDKLDLAKELEEKAKKAGVEIILPSDLVVADAFAADAKTQVRFFFFLFFVLVRSGSYWFGFLRSSACFAS